MRPSGSAPYWATGTQILWRSGRGLLATGAEELDSSVAHYAEPMTVVRDDVDGLVAWLAAGTRVFHAARADGLGKRGQPWSVWLFFAECTREFEGWYVNLEAPHVRDGTAVYTSDHVLDLDIEPDRRMSWGSPFCDGWEHFRPDPAWTVPELPQVAQ